MRSLSGATGMFLNLGSFKSVSTDWYKDSYLKSIETLLKDSSKFKSIPVVPDKNLNYIINFEKRINDLLKKLKNKNVFVKKPIIN